MSKQNNIDDTLRAVSVETHFLFGFLFSRLDFGSENLEEKTQMTRDAILKAIKKAIRNTTHFQNKAKVKSIHFRTDNAGDSKHVIQYYLLIDNPYLIIEFKPSRINLYEEGSRKVWRSGMLLRTIRLYESGMGLYRVTLKIDNSDKNSYLEAIDIISIAEAGSSHRELLEPIDSKRFLTLRKNNRKLDLFETYYEDVSILRNSLSKELRQIFKNTMTGYVYKRLRWIEVQEGLVRSGPMEEECSPFQNPYVFHKIKMSEDLFKIIPGCDEKFETFSNSKEQKLSRISLDIQDIVLRRVEAGRTSPHYVEKYTESFKGDLANMCVSSRAFVNIHIRSMVYISSSTVKANSYDGFVMPALLDTLELVRMKWYAYVMLNRYLDVQVSKLLKQFYLLSEEQISAVEDNLMKCQNTIIALKSEILRVMELPLSYRRASATATTVYDQGERIFEIKELQEIVIRKIDCLDRLFHNVNEVRRRLIAKETDKVLKQTLPLKW